MNYSSGKDGGKQEGIKKNSYCLRRIRGDLYLKDPEKSLKSKYLTRTLIIL